MEFQELLDFIEFENDRAIKNSPEMDDNYRLFVRAVKLTEEVGELSSQIIHYGNFQRREKGKFNRNELAQELADVIIMTLLLAKSTDINIIEALKNKISKISKRYENMNKGAV